MGDGSRLVWHTCSGVQVCRCVSTWMRLRSSLWGLRWPVWSKESAAALHIRRISLSKVTISGSVLPGPWKNFRHAMHGTLLMGPRARASASAAAAARNAAAAELRAWGDGGVGG